MNKEQLVNAMASTSGLTKKDSEAALKAFMSAVETAMQNGEKVTLVGFGTFEVKARAARKGVNPRTKESIKIPATKAVKFKAGKDLKEVAKA